MTQSINSMGTLAMLAYPVTVEADVGRGLPRFDLVGLPDAAVKESKDRVSAALRNCGYELPTGRITVNLAPADVRKVGPIYDLAILLAILTASGQLEVDLSPSVFLGELSLSGEVRPVTGVLPMVLQAKAEGKKAVFVPVANSSEAAAVAGIACYGIRHVNELIPFLIGATKLEPLSPLPPNADFAPTLPDFQDVRGQEVPKRALEIAAAGGHNLLMLGSPGSGKSMLASRLCSILPQMTEAEQIETTKIYSVAGLLEKDQGLITARPFRAPHHTISAAGLAGGGSVPRPGEISLSHNGVLFLDELPEFARSSLEVLRQPMETGQITLSRAGGVFSYPCSFMLVAAMNPCPCGYFGHPTRPCTCSRDATRRYLSRISGPLLDRIDIHIQVPPVEYADMVGSPTGESSAVIRARVNAARTLQEERLSSYGIHCNAHLTAQLFESLCPMTEEAQNLLGMVFDRLALSARAYTRIIRLARTIADLAGDEVIHREQIAEAVQYRDLDRSYWQA